MLTLLNSNTRLTAYNARLRRREATPAAVDLYTAWPLGAGTPFIASTWRYAWKKLTLEIELRGTWSEIEDNKGKLHADLIQGRLQFDDDMNSIYTYALASEPGQSDQYDGFYETVTYNLLAYKMDATTSTHNAAANTTSSFTLANTVLPARTVITLSGTGTVQLTLNGKTIVARNMVAGQPRIIGDGKITQNGVNKWIDTDLPGGTFIEARPGVNSVATVNGSATVLTQRRHL